MVSSTNTTDRLEIAEILLKVALDIIKPKPTIKWQDEISKEKHYVNFEMVPSFTLTCNRMCMRISMSINL
jgi:hypothetical protein